ARGQGGARSLVDTHARGPALVCEDAMAAAKRAALDEADDRTVTPRTAVIQGPALVLCALSRAGSAGAGGALPVVVEHGDAAAGGEPLIGDDIVGAEQPRAHGEHEVVLVGGADRVLGAGGAGREFPAGDGVP